VISVSVIRHLRFRGAEFHSRPHPHSLAELPACIDVARPIVRKNTGAHVAVKRRVRPIAHPRLHVRYDAKRHQWRITLTLIAPYDTCAINEIY
jgi:hypothetical protein